MMICRSSSITTKVNPRRRHKIVAACCLLLLLVDTSVHAFQAVKVVTHNRSTFNSAIRPTLVNPSINNKNNERHAPFFLRTNRSIISREATTTSSSNSDDTTTPTTSKNNKLDNILSKLTSLFPLFVLSSALIATKSPSLLTWVNHGPLITIMLSTVMIGMGMTLTKSDFDRVCNTKKRISSIPVGVLCQFGIMPLAAYFVGSKIMKLSSVHPSLYVGLVLVGCCPGGTASNLVALIAGADVALSVVLTSCSTVLASLFTPVLVKLLVSAGTTTSAGGAASVISISGWKLCVATAKVVLAPILIGMTLNSKLPTLSQSISRFTPFASVLLVSLICGGVVAQNAALSIAGNGIQTALMSVIMLHSIGFLVGYLLPKKGLGYDERTARTISIETGMQNSALAVVLARSIPGGDALMCLPGALSATVHSCLGSGLAAYWRMNKDSSDDDDINHSEDGE